MALHHPPYSSGVHGSTPAPASAWPLLARRRVDLVLTGHDHHYERVVPQDGVTYVVSGGGCKTTKVGRSAFTAVAERTLQFLHVDVVGDRLTVRCVRPDGSLADQFVLRAQGAVTAVTRWADMAVAAGFALAGAVVIVAPAAMRWGCCTTASGA